MGKMKSKLFRKLREHLLNCPEFSTDEMEEILESVNIEEITDVKEAIKLLEEKRDFKVEDMQKIKYRIHDEDIDFFIESDEELLRFANDQAENVDDMEE